MAAAPWTSRSIEGKRHRSAVRALRQVGFAAWYRPWAGNEHIHAIAISDPDLSGPAQRQVSEYYRGGDGLEGDGSDNGPNVTKRTWEQCARAEEGDDPAGVLERTGRVVERRVSPRHPRHQVGDRDLDEDFRRHRIQQAGGGENLSPRD